VIYYINKLDIMHAENKNTIISKAKKILDEVNKIKEDIYGKENN